MVKTLLLYFLIFLPGTAFSMTQAQVNELVLTCEADQIDAWLETFPNLESLEIALTTLNLKIEVLHSQYIPQILSGTGSCRLVQAREHLALAQEKLDREMRPLYPELSDEEFQEVMIDYYLKAGLQKNLPEEVYQVIRQDEPIHRCLQVRHNLQDWLVTQQRQRIIRPRHSVLEPTL